MALIAGFYDRPLAEKCLGVGGSHGSHQGIFKGQCLGIEGAGGLFSETDQHRRRGLVREAEEDTRGSGRSHEVASKGKVQWSVEENLQQVPI